MVVRCFIAAPLLNKKRVKRTTLNIAKASGAELKRACHGDSHRQRGKMTRACCIKLLDARDTKTVSLLVPVALVRLRGSCVVELPPKHAGVAVRVSDSSCRGFGIPTSKFLNDTFRGGFKWIP